MNFNWLTGLGGCASIPRRIDVIARQEENSQTPRVLLNRVAFSLHDVYNRLAYMKSLPDILMDIISTGSYSREQLAEELNVSFSAISRWINNESKPRPNVEGRLREIHAEMNVKPSTHAKASLPFLKFEEDIRKAIDGTLRELREILHRKGRLSSPNEALDELCKLLFAHLMAILDGQEGLSKQSVCLLQTGDCSLALALKEYVKASFDKHLPSSLSHKMEPSDFELRIKAQEDPFAIEILDCFERLAAKDGFKDLGSVKGVDLFNEVFGKFLATSFVDEKEMGQYLTPPEVVRFMVQLAIQDLSKSELETLCNPNDCFKFGLILDPSCGVGSFLTEVINTLSDKVLTLHGESGSKKWMKHMVTKVLVGIDKSERMIRLALTSMAMYGAPAAKLHLANSLSHTGNDGRLTSSLAGKAGLILTNPPFGAEFTGDDLVKYKLATTWAQRPPAKVDSELLFIERYLEWLAPGGRLLAIVPDSILTNKGLFEDLRKSIAPDVEIRSVTSLPEVTFSAAGTNTKTSVLHLAKHTTSRSKRHKTHFAICKNVGYSVATRDTQKTKISNGQGQLPLILQEYLASDDQLRIGRRVSKVEDSARWDANFHASLPLEIEQRIKIKSPADVFVSEVAKLSDERADPRRWGTGTFRYIEISDVDSQACMVHSKEVDCSEAPSRARKVVRKGDVLYSTVRPERRTVGIVGEDLDGSICTTGFAVLRPQKIDPLVLAYLLKTDFVTMQVLRNNIGISYPAIDESCLPSVLLPIERKLLQVVKSSAEQIRDLEMKLRSHRASLINDIQNATSEWLGQEVM